MPDDTADRRAIVHTALLTPSPLAGYQAGPMRRAVHGDVVLSAGLDFHHALVLGPVASERVFALAATFFEGKGGYHVELDVKAAGEVERALLSQGWRLDEEEPALVLPELPPVAPPAPTELDIRPVTDEAGLADFFALSAAAARWVPSLAAATDPAVALFVGYVDGRPAATSRLACFGRVTEITGVTTVSELRRRGYGTAMTWAAIAEGAQRGCTAAMLTATAMGYPVYVRMGFRPVCTFRTYLPLEDRADISESSGRVSAVPRT